jgi:O-antigen ligase
LPRPSFVILEPWRTVINRFTIAGVILVPLVVSWSGDDSFRLPKELVLRALGIGLLVLLASAALLRGVRAAESRAAGIAIALAVAGIAWVAGATLFSTHPRISVFSLFRVTTCVLIFACTLVTARFRSIRAMDAVTFTGIANALVAVSQRSGIYNPLPVEAQSVAQRTTAFLGNPNDVGAFLVLPILILVTLLLCGERRWKTTIAGLVITTAGLLASTSLTAIISVAAGLGVLLWSHRRMRRALIVAVLAAVVVAGLTRAVRERVAVAVYFAKIGSTDNLVSGRVPAFAAASSMIVRHPLTGVGPGCFGANYLDYRGIPANVLTYDAARQGDPVNFGEVHNDHLQVMAEAGIPAYLILAAFLIYIGRPRRASADESTRAAAARHLLPAATLSLAVLSLASFPLQLAATLVNYCFVGGLAFGWLQDDRDA